QRSVQVAGRTTGYHYRAGQLPPTANTLADGKRIDFVYEGVLGNALLSTEAQDQTPERLEYHPLLGRPVAASNALGSQKWQFTAAGKPLADSWTVDGQTHTTTWQESLGGTLLGFTDTSGTPHKRSFDAQGRVTELTVGEVTTQFAYDAFSRPISLTTQHDGRTLEKQITYDAMGREHTCTFTVNGVGEERVIVQTLLYSDLDQVLSRTWQDGEQNGAETFAYDSRGRLVHYSANADAAPHDPFGNPIAEQRFTFNALDGYQSIETRFLDDTTDQASFTHADDDPTQVVAISHTHASWPQTITLTYDACGRVVSDSLGRSMAWNAQDRLERIDYNGQSCLYRYDPSGKLCDRVLQDTLTRSFYSGGQQTHEQCGDDRLHLIGDG
ncbi:RHS repeat protein, partial [Pseudomonas sp. SWRI51]|uniref:RHS repeat protein n=1 Tax=Pseudomonas sp. SWRI51 TaxID=2745491 RepID=UPI00164750AA